MEFPGHELDDIALHVVVEDLAQRCGDIGLRVHAVQLASPDQESDALPGLRPTGAPDARVTVSRVYTSP